MTIQQAIKELAKKPLTEGQRKCLRELRRCFNARRLGGGRLHHPSHYVPQVVALARKYGILKDGETLRRLGK